MKNKIIFLLVSCSIFSSCKLYEKKIIGAWSFLEKHNEIQSNDKEVSMISEFLSNSKKDLGLPMYYYKNKTFMIDHEDYTTLGRYKINGDTLLEIYNSNGQIDTIKNEIVKINQKIMIIKDWEGIYVYYIKVKS